jgi:hypothetical protein
MALYYEPCVAGKESSVLPLQKTGRSETSLSVSKTIRRHKPEDYLVNSWDVVVILFYKVNYSDIKSLSIISE